jgi:hypothetical protein
MESLLSDEDKACEVSILDSLTQSGAHIFSDRAVQDVMVT